MKFSIVIFDNRITDGYGVKDFDTMTKAWAFFRKVRRRGLEADIWYNPEKVDMEDILRLPSNARLLNQC